LIVVRTIHDIDWWQIVVNLRLYIWIIYTLSLVRNLSKVLLISYEISALLSCFLWHFIVKIKVINELLIIEGNLIQYLKCFSILACKTLECKLIEHQLLFITDRIYWNWLQNMRFITWYFVLNTIIVEDISWFRFDCILRASSRIKFYYLISSETFIWWIPYSIPLVFPILDILLPISL
jgi:hypothetical protein